MNESKKRLIEKNEKFVKIKFSSMKTFEQNEKFFSDLESYIQLYHSKCASINQGLAFYSEFTMRMNQLGQKITDFLYSREIEKNDMIKAFIDPSHTSSAYPNNNSINPNTNTITNMDYQFRYCNQNPNQNNKYGGYGNFGNK